MELQTRLLLTRAFRKLQEGVLEGLELVDKMRDASVPDSPENVAQLITHLKALEEHCNLMRDSVELYVGARTLLDVVSEKKAART